MKIILGISAFYHDSAAAIVCDGKIVAAAQEERFTRQKHTADFPVQAILYCLKTAKVSIKELDAVVFYDKPFLTFERLLETYYSFAPKGLISFIKAVPVWLKDKLFLKQTICKSLAKIEPFERDELKLLFTEHHLSHAASAFYPSPFEEAAILTIDGVGEWDTLTICQGKGRQITKLKSINFPHSVGLLYSAFTYFLGFKVNSGEYKLMGLAPFGIENDSQTQLFIKIIKEKLVTIYEDGSIWLDQQYFGYATTLRMVNDNQWQNLFSLKKRQPEDSLDQVHCNLALAIQKVTEEIVLKLAKHVQELTGSKNLCLAGGVALNCVANGVLLKSKLFENIYVQPAAGDAGGSLGAALAAYYLCFSQERKLDYGIDQMQGTYLGPAYEFKDIETLQKEYKAVSKRFTDRAELNKTIAAALSTGKIIGWFQDRMEFGPRALGNRSILADPRKAETQKKVNLKIKFRENFRPFAPAVLEEDADQYFDLAVPSPYMSIVARLKENVCHTLPADYAQLSMTEKLAAERSTISAVTHVDFSARVQTVSKQSNPKFHALIAAFKELTQTSVLINTSFNVRGEPIVCTPTDAYLCFMHTDMDVLVIGEVVYYKTDQEDWENREKWKQRFDPD